ncbi:branched-chain amino acid ABC transporter permease [Phycicoccus duodecadis]|uniref:Amino acid/amide ABC transporter membrane protein 2 (HAAT family) n=1 Tax=Phycicoccus duodecadis TaxID=173053 RepID=A0A2N3YEG1_9MICO|nr:branched-chain amino acid ABC transporter permease [Phycicoccus duodecadis]PKW25235.1 amino acid/amide ABC transporter membrane protein 2 (HAAT family) [Phycicoccus duodecadis]
MSTVDRTEGETPVSSTERMQTRFGSRAALLGIAGGALLLLSGLLSWSFDDRVLGDLSIRFYPAGIQIYAMVVGVVGLVLGLLLLRRPAWLDPGRGLRALGYGSLAFVLAALISIAYQAGGLVNVNEGGWVGLVGAALLLAAGLLSPARHLDVHAWPRLASWQEISIIVVLLAVLLFTTAYTLNIDDAATFGCLLIVILTVAISLLGSGFGGYVGFIGQNNRRPLLLAAFLVAFLFPFTQDGSDANMSIATQILIFAATALGLNIVVGLAGLLDLGYIAFLGTGAYVGAMLSQSAFATIGWKPPFLVVMLLGMMVASIFGLIIGTPTLRVSGDYLAIVTLGFGEIFRLAMFNLDGNNGPELTNGPNGIPAIPDLNFFGFDFGATHTLAGIPLGRFSNYYFLLLVLIAFVILVFTRLNDSRIGRGWVAIREDERAAEAMGVNVFGLKLLAFAVGASLAGLAGTIKAHQDTSVTPDQYIFLESAFLLAAVVLGGMGTVAGVLVGATILKLLPEKARVVNDYRLLIFGLLLVIMMRFRPEGIVPSKRRQLEFHEDDEELVELAQTEHLEAK